MQLLYPLCQTRHVLKAFLVMLQSTHIAHGVPVCQTNPCVANKRQSVPYAEAGNGGKSVIGHVLGCTARLMTNKGISICMTSADTWRR